MGFRRFVASFGPAIGRSGLPRFQGGTAVIVGGMLFQLVSSFAAGILVAHALGADGYGALNIAKNLFGALVAVAPLGIDVTLLKYGPRLQTSGRFLTRVRRLRLVVAALNLAVVALFVFVLADLMEQDLYRIPGLAGIVVATMVGLPLAADLAILGAVYRVCDRPASFAVLANWIPAVVRLSGAATTLVLHLAAVFVAAAGAAAFALGWMPAAVFARRLLTTPPPTDPPAAAARSTTAAAASDAATATSTATAAAASSAVIPAANAAAASGAPAASIATAAASDAASAAGAASAVSTASTASHATAAAAASSGAAAASSAADADERMPDGTLTILKESVWICLNVFSYGTLKLVDVLILGLYWPASVVGSYGVIGTISQLVAVYPMAISQTLGPRVARRYQEGDVAGVGAVLDDYIRTASLTGSFLFGGIAAFGSDLDLVFGPTFTFDPWIAFLMPLGWLFSAVLAPTGYALSMTGWHRAELAILATGLCLLGALCFLLIPTYGAHGAAVAVVVTFAGIDLTRFWLVSQRLGIWIGRLGDLVPPVVALGLGLLARMVPDALLDRSLVSMIVGCLVYAAAYATFALLRLRSRTPA